MVNPWLQCLRTAILSPDRLKAGRKQWLENYKLDKKAIEEQGNGEHYGWFEGRASRCCLMNIVDDATGTTMSFLNPYAESIATGRTTSRLGIEVNVAHSPSHEQRLCGYFYLSLTGYL
jgi:hypothetical protein